MVSLTRSYAAGSRRLILLFLAVAMPAAFDPGAADVFHVLRYSLLLTAAVLLLGLWALEWLLLDRRPDWRNGLHWPALALLGWLALATAFSEDPRTAIVGQSREYDGLLSAAALTVILFATAQAFRGGHAVSALRAMYFGGGGLAALYGLVQLHDRCFPASRWDPVNWASANLSQSALLSTFGNPNHLAAFFAILMPIGLALFLMERRVWVRVAIVTLTAVMLLEIVHAQSRGALLAMGIGVAVAAVLLWPGLRAHAKPAFAAFALFVAALFVLPLLFGSPACPGAAVDLPGRIRSAVDVEGRTPTAERLELWRAAALMGVDRPLVGFGPSSYRWYLGAYQSERLANMDADIDFIDAPHNTFLYRLTSGGVPAVAAFLLVLVAASAITINAWRRRVGMQIALSGAAAGAAAFVVQVTFNVEHLALSFLFWSLLGIVCAVGLDAVRPLSAAAPLARGQSQSRRKRSERRPREVARARTALAVLTIAVAALAAVTALAPYRADRSYHEAVVAQRVVPATGPLRRAALDRTSERFRTAMATNGWEPTYIANYAAFVATTPGSFATADRATVIAALLDTARLLEEAIVQQPRNHLWVGSLAEVLLKIDELRPDPVTRDAGIAAAERALLLQPWRERPAVVVAQSLTRTGGGSDRNRALIDRALSYSPRDVPLLREAARLSDARRETTAARDLWLRVLALAPGDSEAQRALDTR